MIGTVGSLFLHGRLTLVALVRRRLALAIFVLMPVLLYAATHEAMGRSVRALVFGITWAVSTVAFFATTAASEVEPRLRLAGRSWTFLAAARIAALVTLGLGLAGAYWAVVVVDHPVRSGPAVAVDFAVSALVAVALGTAVGTVVSRELEGTLVLFVAAGLQAVVNPFDTVARFLPLWSSRELGTWAIDGPDQGSLGEGLVHAAVVIGLCLIVMAAGRTRIGHRA